MVNMLALVVDKRSVPAAPVDKPAPPPSPYETRRFGSDDITLYFDLSPVRTIDLPLLLTAIAEAQEASDANEAIDPAVVVVGRQLEPSVQQAIQDAGAIVFDLDLPFNSKRFDKAEDLLKFFERAQNACPGATPQEAAVGAVDDDIENYYKPLTENDDKNLSALLKRLKP